MKKEKGITLVALVVTIIIILILAAVTIRTMTKTDIINETLDVKNSYDKKSDEYDEKMQEVKNAMFDGTI